MTKGKVYWAEWLYGWRVWKGINKFPTGDLVLVRHEIPDTNKIKYDWGYKRIDGSFPFYSAVVTEYGIQLRVTHYKRGRWIKWRVKFSLFIKNAIKSKTINLRYLTTKIKHGNGS